MNQISEKVLKDLWNQRFSAGSHSKMNENWLFCCCFQSFQLVFILLAVPRFCCYFQTFCVAFLEFDEFQKIFRNFSFFFQKFIKNFWKNMKFLKKLWIQRFSTASHSKMDGKLVVLLLFSNCSASFSLLLAVPRYQKWRKTSCFLRLFSNFLRSFSRIVTNFRFFQKFLKIFWKIPKISENFSNPVIFCCQPFKNGWKLVVLLLFSKCSASFSLLLAVPRWKTKCFAAIFKLFAFLFSNFDEFRKMFRNELIKKKMKKIEKK